MKSYQPEISVIICTYRNPTMLRECLNSILEQDLPPEDFEVLVIDNNSKDETPEIVYEYIHHYTNIRSIFEPKQGLSYARNRGIREARGEIVVFTDDDAIVGDNWIRNLTKYYKLSGDIWAVGGKTLPLWRTTRPDWITDDMLVSLSIRDYGVEPRYIEWPDRIIGVNCSFRKEVFEQTGYFNEKLGRKGDTLFDQEDIEIQRIIHGLQKRIYYAPDAVVWHVISEKRTNQEYLDRRSDGHIRTCCIIDFTQNRKIFLTNIISHLRHYPRSAFHHWKDKNNLGFRTEFLIHKSYIKQAIIIITSFYKN